MVNRECWHSAPDCRILPLSMPFLFLCVPFLFIWTSNFQSSWSSFVHILCHVPEPCFAQNGVSAHHWAQVLHCWYPNRQNWAVLILICPRLWLFHPLNLGDRKEKKKKKGCFGLFIAYPSDYCCYYRKFTAICQSRKKKTITSKNQPYSKIYFVRTYNLHKYSSGTVRWTVFFLGL